MEDTSVRESNIVKFQADDLIYNRFDLIYEENIERHLYEYQDKSYIIDAYYEEFKAYLNIWGKQFPQNLFENMIDDIFKIHPEIGCIEIKRAKNDYRNLLNEGNDIFISLPETVEELLSRISKKSRYNLKREKRLCEETNGKLATVIYSSNIPNEIVDLYFDWKKITHGTDYHMTAEEYLRKYHVTDGMLLRAGDKDVGILFFCQVNNTVYLENFSYNTEMEKYSPGYIIYEMFLEELIKRKCTYLYLGGGQYEYKRRFEAEESTAYSGIIYRKEVFESLSAYFKKNNVKKIAIYGLGAMGHAFLKTADQLNVDLAYGIDKEKKQIDGLAIYRPEDDLEEADAVIITLKVHNKKVEELLKARFEKVYYWHDIAIEGWIKEERK